MHRSARTRQRGAAAVEAALSMLLIVPTFLYALFLDDLLRYAADLQETVTSTPWDFTVQDYTRGSINGAPVQERVQHSARLMFCDHESSSDNYQRGLDCDSQHPHQGKALSGHACWLHDGAHPITCEDPRTGVGDLARGEGSSLFSRYKEQFGKQGGLFECHAQSVVENHLLPKRFLQEFSEVKLSKAYSLQKQRFALLADPWALNHKQLSLQPGDEPGEDTPGGQLYSRVKFIYQHNSNFEDLTTYSRWFTLQMSIMSVIAWWKSDMDELIEPNVALPPLGQLPPTQQVDQDEDSADYYAIPWRDGEWNPNEWTAMARGSFYLGCTFPESC